MGRPLHLESFDTIETPLDETLCDGTAVTATMTQSYIEGYASGYATGFAAGRDEAEAACAADQSALREELVQALADLSFTHAEVRAHLLTLLAPLFAAITDAVLPQMLRASLAPHLCELLTTAAAADVSLPLTLTLHPDHMMPMQAMLSSAVATPFTMRADDSLSRGVAVIRAGETGTQLDLDAVRAAIEAAISAIFDAESQTEEGQKQHG